MSDKKFPKNWLGKEDDYELLSLAAKAVGVDGWDNYGERFHFWNPLRDNADVFRLATDLEFSIYVLPMKIGVAKNGGGYLIWHERSIYGNEADYRRAIVRAAAEIGKAMP